MPKRQNKSGFSKSNNYAGTVPKGSYTHELTELAVDEIVDDYIKMLYSHSDEYIVDTLASKYKMPMSGGSDDRWVLAYP